MAGFGFPTSLHLDNHIINHILPACIRSSEIEKKSHQFEWRSSLDPRVDAAARRAASCAETASLARAASSRHWLVDDTSRPSRHQSHRSHKASMSPARHSADLGQRSQAPSVARCHTPMGGDVKKLWKHSFVPCRFDNFFSEPGHLFKKWLVLHSFLTIWMVPIFSPLFLFPLPVLCSLPSPLSPSPFPILPASVILAPGSD
jgi:hypothetical protein